MHSLDRVSDVLELRTQGLGARRIARRTGLPLSTVSDWVAGQLPRSYRPGTHGCSVCGGAAHIPGELPYDYIYLLGLYLGDGSISRHPRDVFKLRVFLDRKYPAIVAECAKAMQAVAPRNKVNHFLTVSNCFEVFAFSKSWPCLFPQHGPGMKHEREIKLLPWQRDLARVGPELLLRGLIQSDGCRFTNTRGKSDTWSAPRYGFSNRSEGIKQIFCDACDQLGLHWTTAGKYVINVSRAKDVAALDRFVGPKY